MKVIRAAAGQLSNLLFFPVNSEKKKAVTDKLYIITGPKRIKRDGYGSFGESGGGINGLMETLLLQQLLAGKCGLFTSH